MIVYVSNGLEGRDTVYVVPMHMSVCNKPISFIRNQIYWMAVSHDSGHSCKIAVFRDVSHLVWCPSRNISNCLPDYTASQSLLWQPQISLFKRSFTLLSGGLSSTVFSAAVWVLFTGAYRCASSCFS